MWVEKHGPTWRVRDETGGRKVTLAAGFPTKTAAKHALAQLRADQLRGDQLVPRGGKMTLAEWLDIWQPTWEQALKPSSARSEPARIRNHIRPLLGDHRLEDITRLTVRTWLGQLAAGGPGRRPLAAKTIRSVHGLLHQAMDAAVEERLIRANPIGGRGRKGLPPLTRREMRFLTDPEIGRLLAATPPHWRPLVLLLVTTGLRWGEAVALRVQDVDVLAGRLTVLRTMHELSGSAQIVFTAPKTARSRRTVAFEAKTAAALAGLVAGKERDELVFTAPRGGPVRVRNFRRAPRLRADGSVRLMGWARWCADAGLPGLRIHDLRHTHAAMLISAGVPLTAVQRRLGHSSIAVTSDLYGHLRAEVDEGILAAVTAAVGDVDLSAEVADELAEV